MAPGRWEPGSTPLPLSCLLPGGNVIFQDLTSTPFTWSSYIHPALLYQAQPVNGPNALTWLSRSSNWAFLSLIRESYFDLVCRRHRTSICFLTSVITFLGDVIWLSVNNTSLCS